MARPLYLFFVKGAGYFFIQPHQLAGINPIRLTGVLHPPRLYAKLIARLLEIFQ